MQANDLSLDMMFASKLAYMFRDGSTAAQRQAFIQGNLDGYELDTSFWADGYFTDPGTGFDVVAHIYAYLWGQTRLIPSDPSISIVIQ